MVITAYIAVATTSTHQTRLCDLSLRLPRVYLVGAIIVPNRVRVARELS